MAFVNKVNGIPIDDFLAVNPDWTKVPALDKYGNPYLFEDGTPQYTVKPKSDEEIPTVDPFSGQSVSTQDQASFANVGGISPEAAKLANVTNTKTDKHAIKSTLPRIFAVLST